MTKYMIYYESCGQVAYNVNTFKYEVKYEFIRKS